MLPARTLYSSQAACDGEIFSASLSLLQGGIRLAIIGCCLKLGIDHLDGPFIPSSPTVSRSPYVQSPRSAVSLWIGRVPRLISMLDGLLSLVQTNS